VISCLTTPTRKLSGVFRLPSKYIWYYSSFCAYNLKKICFIKNIKLIWYLYMFS
jgi:hypothetical protein